MSGRTTLKSYFLKGATPTEANFADLIDSVVVISEDLTDSLSSSFGICRQVTKYIDNKSC